MAGGGGGGGGGDCGGLGGRVVVCGVVVCVCDCFAGFTRG